MLDIYTDGACRGNGKATNLGGWGFICVRDGKEVYRQAGAHKDTTNNREELLAVINALDYWGYCTDDIDVTIHTDSQYVKLGITEWIEGWIAKGWKTSKGDPVKNQDLWKRLHSIHSSVQCISFEWVRGHDGNQFNEAVDLFINKTMDDSIPCTHS